MAEKISEAMQNNGSVYTKKPQFTPEGIHFTELLKVLKLRRKLIYVITAAAVLGTLFRQVFYVPFYTAQTMMTIQKAENSPMQAALMQLGGPAGYEEGNRIKKYLDYLNSNDFFMNVAEHLKFQEGYHLLNLTLPNEMSITKKKFWRQFISTNFGRKTEYVNDTPEPELVPVEILAGLLRSLTAAEGQGVDTLRIKVTTLDPFTSMVLANTVTEVFIKKTAERDYAEVSEVKRFIQEQLETTTQRLKQSEFALIEFKKRHNIISISAEQNAFSGKLSELETNIEKARLKLQENQKLIDYYERALAKSEQKLITKGAAGIRSSHAALTSRLRQQLDGLRYKKVLMQAQGFNENSWQMAEINREIDKSAEALREALTQSDGEPEEDEPVVSLETAREKVEALRNDNRQLEAQLSTSDRSRSSLLKNLGGLPKDEQALLTLSRDVDLQFELYSNLKKKLQEVEIQQVALQSHVLLTERASVPPPAPRTNLIIKVLFACLVGVFIGGSIAFLLEAIDPTIKHPADLERLELVTLGSIPHVDGSPLRQGLGVHTYRPDLLICREKPESGESMAFKHIRAQITNQTSHDGTPSKIFTVTSPEHADGKSFVSANLAISLAQLEKRVLLIDCDLRNPSLPWLFGYKETAGLSSLLTLKATVDEVLLRRRMPFLDILPSGYTPSNPTELISNEKFRVMLDHFKSLYDYIIIDAPPAVPVVDASILASLSDSVILTTCFRKTRKDVLLVGLKRILQVSHRNIFAILNNVWEVDEQSRYEYVSRDRENRMLEPIDSQAELDKFHEILTDKKAG